jgi:hypothetical protein
VFFPTIRGTPAGITTDCRTSGKAAAGRIQVSEVIWLFGDLAIYTGAHVSWVKSRRGHEL